MENKYYTPTIEEFHVGFEYESEEDPYNGIWKEQEVDQFSLGNVRVYFKDSDVEIRVKHLDQEDVESFGIGAWTDSRGYWRGFKTKNDNQYYVFHHNVDRIQSWCIIEIVDKDTEKRRVLFNGMIKNKSELKKVLKMIGYESK
jgi:hypothetical protein